MRRKNRSGFTLIELLVVVSIIALLISILLPAIGRARELARRAYCAANLNGIGKGVHTYAVENNDSWPVAVPNSTMNTPSVPVEYYNMTGRRGGIGMDPADSAVNPAGNYWRELSTTQTLWRLVKTGAHPKSFVCLSAGDTPDAVDNPADYWDFPAKPGSPAVGQDRGWAAGTNNELCVSYGVQNPYGPKGRPTTEVDLRMALAADKGPYGGVSLGRSDIAAPDPAGVKQDASPDEWMPFNSPNHGGLGSGEGQVVMYADAHAEFLNRPIVGVGYDNIYTAWKVNGNQPDSVSRSWGRRPSAQIPTLVPAEHTDSLIYP
jgi:prepilin-type N-terminal cleavage/methylation domain-containing protein